MKSIRIAYIGGGSKQWARVLMNDLALCSELTGEIGLYDPDKNAALRNQAIGNRINQNKDCVSQWIYYVYDTLDECLMNAEFVIISILPGTFEEMRSDVHAPEKYGIYQSVGDTTGPGGVLRAMRTVPCYETFAKAIKRICPNAWVINFTNPMSICVKTLYDTFPDIKAFGCCHEVFHTQDFLCDILKEETGIEAKRRDLYTDVSGINHFTWITGAKYKETEIMDYLNNFISKHYKEGYYEHGPVDQYQTDTFAYANRVKMDLYLRYGALGAAGDRHLVEFMNPTWYLNSREQINKWKFAITTVDFRIKQQKERIDESIQLANGTKRIEIKKSDEEAVDMMLAILGYKTLITNVNLPNTGQIQGYPRGAIVETNAIFSNNCVRPIVSSALPDGVNHLVLHNLYNSEALYKGIKNRDFKKIFSSFINQPLCSKLTISEAKELFYEMINNTIRYLENDYSLQNLKM